jgi:hypothetical protein
MTNIDQYRAVWVCNMVKCTCCHHKWVAVHVEALIVELECPNCHEFSEVDVEAE